MFGQNKNKTFSKMKMKRENITINQVQNIDKNFSILVITAMLGEI